MSKAVHVLICLLFLSVSVSFAQPPKKQTPNQNPNENPRRISVELNDADKKFLTEDAIYILTPEEREAFKKLKTRAEREAFIIEFWRRRDPTPDTEENEFREEHYERIAYANEHFSSGTPGWKTDRGRIYIRWGKPDEIESHPSGGAYNRPSYEGGGTITAYPFETWFYRHLEGVGDGVEIEFVDPTGTGEYRIARDAEEKNALANVTGPRNPYDAVVYQREQDSPLRRAEQAAALETPPHIKFSELDRIASGNSGVLDKNPLEFGLRVDFFRQSDDAVVAAFTIQTENKDLQFQYLGGLETAQINIFGRITSIANRRSGIFEDSVTTNASSQELAEMRAGRSIYQKLISLAPGIYKIDAVVRDVNTGNTGLVHQSFTIPRYDDKKLSTSTLVLASNLRPTDANDIGKMFVVGKNKVVPNLTGIFKKGQGVGVYLQIYNAGIDQTTLRPSVDVDYIVFKDGKEISRIREDWSGLSDSGRRLTLARHIPTANLAAGDYEIAVRISNRVNTQTIEHKGKFTVTQ